VALLRLRSICCALALCLAASVPAAAAKVPSRFFGVVAEPELLSDATLGPVGSSLEQEMNRMMEVGIGSVRISFFWAPIEPYASWADVPDAERARFTDVGGRPFDFTLTDRAVSAAAARGIELLPVLVWAPDWAARYPGQFASPPRNPDDFATFAAVLAGRYGTNGTFWRDHPELPRVPIRDWQIWNEPTMSGFWLDQPFAPEYVKLLAATRPRLRQADPRSRTVLAGLVYDSPGALRSIYNAGGRRYFDVVALHPFTLYVRNIGTIVKLDRQVMRSHGDAKKPVFLTEVSWPSARGKTPLRYGYEMTEKGQAQRIITALPYLVRQRASLHIERFFWYTWLTRETDPTYPFDYAGLSRLDPGRIVAKPALGAYRRTALKLEGCKRKTVSAKHCG
jgi:hypothetical protein